MNKNSQKVKEEEETYHDEFKGVQMCDSSPHGILLGKSFYGRVVSGMESPGTTAANPTIKISSTPLEHKQMS